MATSHHLQAELEAAQAQIQHLTEQLTTERETAHQTQAQLQQKLDHQQHTLSQLTVDLQRLQWIISASPAATYTCDVTPPYPCTYISQNVEMVLGYTPGEFCAEPDFWVQRLHPEDAPRVFGAHPQWVFGAHPQLFQQGHLRQDYRLRHRDGHYVWVRDSLILLHDTQGQPREVVGFFQDINAAKQDEMQIKRQLAAIEAAADGIAILENGDYIYVNRAHLEIFGYTQPEEMLGKSWTMLYGPEELARFDQEVMPILGRDGVWMGEAIATRKDGTTFNERLSLTFTEDGWLICICADITARKEAELALTITNQELIKATRLKSEFLANMSHELRTPLTAILGMTEGLQEEIFGPLTVPQQQSLALIESSSSHLLDLINDVLDVAKIEAGQLELHYVNVGVDALCVASLAMVKQQAQQKSLQLSLRIPPDLPDLYGDERRLRQILVNLLSNAVKFTPQGGDVTLTASYRPFSQEEQASNREFSHPWEASSATLGLLTLAVTDTGIGISPEDARKLFQPFVQVSSALNRAYEGTGLGLALVKQITEMHGGKVSFTSHVGQGSCFSIQLPIVATPAQ
ncbi:MAG: PAS domain-containing protein [Leptolyngbya sp.]|nr:PAS domain-containing protein [Leptolyngbya sp.]